MGLIDRMAESRMREFQSRGLSRDYEVVEVTKGGNKIIRIYNPALLLTNQGMLKDYHIFSVMHAFERGEEGNLPRSPVRDVGGRGFLICDGNHRSSIADLYGKTEAIEYFVARSPSDEIVCPRGGKGDLEWSNELISRYWHEEWDGTTSRGLRKKYPFLKDVSLAKKYFEDMGCSFDLDVHGQIPNFWS